MTKTVGTPAELLHKDIKTLFVTGKESADIAFTTGNIGFTAKDRILYRISVQVGGAGFAAGTEKIFYVKVTKSVTVPIDGSTLNVWKKLHDTVPDTFVEVFSYS